MSTSIKIKHHYMSLEARYPTMMNLRATTEYQCKEDRLAWLPQIKPSLGSQENTGQESLAASTETQLKRFLGWKSARNSRNGADRPPLVTPDDIK